MTVRPLGLERILDEPARVVALIRLAAVPVFLVGERAIDHPDASSATFRIILAVGAAYALGLAWRVFTSPGRAPGLRLTFPVDLLLLGLLTFASGGPFSQLRYGFFIVPVAAAMLVGPLATGSASVAALLCYLVATVSYPEERAPAFALQLTNTVYFLWVGLAATLLSAVLTRRQRLIADLSDERGLLVARAIEAEERERRRLAEALHDDAIQNLLAARQALGASGPDLDLVRTGVDRTVAQLRDAVFDLHPYLLRHAGLEAALREVADRSAEHAPDIAWTVDVDEGAVGPHAEVTFAIARELMRNAVRHSGAGEVDVVVAREGGDVRITVADDGAGIDRAAARDAPANGHVGLASCAERAEALGGRLELTSASHSGTRIDVRLPTGAGPAA